MLLRTRIVNGLKLNLLQRKAGRIGILLIHGNSSCKEVFSKQLSELMKTDFSIVVPDLPGHGGSENSPRPSSTYSFPGYARILGTLMRVLGYDSFHIVGWSLGGHVGIEMSAFDPAVRSLLISGTPPIRLSPAGVQEGFRWTNVTALAGRRHLGVDDTRRYVRTMMGQHLPDEHYLTKMAKRTDGNARMWMVKNGLAGFGVDEVHAVRTLDQPLAVIYGSRDPFLRADYLYRIRFKNVWKRGPVMIEAGHAPHWENPQTFNCAMAEFLNHVN